MELRTKRMRLADLTPADYNPRDISADALDGLAASIERFGLVQPIIFNERTGNVVGGHRRLEVLLRGKRKTTDVVLVDLPLEEEKALNLALNNPATQGTFTPAVRDILAELQESLPDLAADLRLDAIQVPAFDIQPVSLPEVAVPEKCTTREMTFALTERQAAKLEKALALAKMKPFGKTGNANSNGNAIARIAEEYISGQG